MHLKRCGSPLGMAILTFLLLGQILTAGEAKIVCIGDCITKGDWWAEGVGMDTRWVDRLGTRSEWTAVNAGLDGMETHNLWHVREVLRAHPDAVAVVLMVGVNDFRSVKRLDARRVTRARLNMQRIIEMVRHKLPHARILLASPLLINPSALSAKWKMEGFGRHTARMVEMLAATYEALAVEQNVDYINMTRSIRPEMLPDGVHPDLAGHARIARAVGSKLATAHRESLRPAAPRFINEAAIVQGYDKGWKENPAGRYPGLDDRIQTTRPLMRNASGWMMPAFAEPERQLLQDCWVTGEAFERAPAAEPLYVPALKRDAQGWAYPVEPAEPTTESNARENETEETQAENTPPPFEGEISCPSARRAKKLTPFWMALAAIHAR